MARNSLRSVQTTQQESFDSVEEFAESLPDKFVLCRELMHNWNPYHVTTGEGGGFVRTLRCSRCRAKKEQEFAESGMVMRSKMIYPDGYLSAGLGRLVGEDRDVLRRVSLVRSVTSTINKQQKGA